MISPLIAALPLLAHNKFHIYKTYLTVLILELRHKKRVCRELQTPLI